MGSYISAPDLAVSIRAIDRRLVALERQTQQAHIPLARVTTTTAAVFLASEVTGFITFNEADVDTVGMWNPAASDRLTVKHPGVYTVSANALFVTSSISPGWREMMIRSTQANGGPERGWARVNVPANNPSAFTDLSVSDSIPLAAGDSVRVRVKHNDGIAIEVRGWSLSVAWTGTG